jgi:hypothetical protein
VRRAIVTLAGAGLTPSRGAITDDEGRFTLATLPAGRFTLIVARATFVTSVYGARRPGRPGTSISVAEGQTVQNLVMRMWRGAVIAGTVRDEAGAPASNVEVTAVPRRSVTDGNLLTLSNNGVRTNERGEFRIFGLAPGTYVVSAEAPAGGGGGQMIALSDAEVDAALDAVRRRTSGPIATAPAAPIAPPKPFDYAPVFFPGSASVSQATPITVQPGQEVTGVDFSLQRVATAVIDGAVWRPDGSPAAGASVQLTAIVPPGGFEPESAQVLNTTARPDGTFRIPQVTPGSYTLVAKAPVQAPARAAQRSGTFVSVGNPDPSVWAQTQVSMAGTDLSGLALQLEPGLRLTGKLVFDGAAKPPADLTKLRVGLRPPGLPTRPGVSINFPIAFVSPAAVRADGTFDLINILPGAYQFTVTMPGNDGAVWWPRTAMLGDRDLLEGQIEIGRAADAGIIVTFSDRPAELSGTLRTPTGAPASDVFVIAYAADRAYWLPSARRVRAVRPDASGRYLMANVPPGDYLLSAVEDVDQDQWQDPAFLETLAATSLKVTISEGEKKILDLQLGGGPR